MNLRKLYQIRNKLFIAASLDVLLCSLAWACAFSLRFNFIIPDTYFSNLLKSLPYILGIKLFFLISIDLYSNRWRFTSIKDLKNIFIFCVISGLTCFTFIYLTRDLYFVPRSIWVIDFLLSFLMLSGLRVIYRSYIEWKKSKGTDPHSKEKVIIIGAGSAGQQLCKELDRHKQYHILGLLDDNPKLRDRKIYNYRILGDCSQLQYYIENHNVTTIILAIPGATYQQRRRILSTIDPNSNINLLTVPTLNEILSGKVSFSKIKKVELNDLLGRNPVNISIDNISNQLNDKVIFVSGAGGSIGSELCRQLCKFQIKELLLFDISEPSLYEIHQELCSTHPHIKITPLIGDVKNTNRLNHLFHTHSPHIVFHAAAYKHVPLMEQYNQEEAIRNNSWGSFNCYQCAINNNVQKFILISTDKAVNPTNIMGASKRIAEKLCLYQHNSQKGAPCELAIVRFGNVLGSTGSVIPKFKKQIENGGPVTVTHPDIERFFMSIPEAAKLVLQGFSMSTGGEVFVLEMGTPVKLVNLAKDLIRLSGFSLEQIEIKFTGLRPGEKMYEELFTEEESIENTPHPKIKKAKVLSCSDNWFQNCLAWVKQEQIPHVARELKSLNIGYCEEKDSPLLTPDDSSLT